MVKSFTGEKFVGVGLSVSEQLDLKLKEYCKKHDLTASQVMRQALRAFLGVNEGSLDNENRTNTAESGGAESPS